jgi:predicted TPR repeat methyltransferase
MPRLKINPAIGLTPVINGYLGYNAEADRLYELPPLAAGLIDGSRTEDEIVALAPEESRESICVWLAEGYRSGLLVDGEPEPARWLSARELHELADKLAHWERLDLAIEVQEKAAERAPGEAEHWNQLGLMLQIYGQREKAVEAYTRYLELRPEDAYTRHRLTAMKGEKAPERASDESMVQEFDYFSANYDAKMRERLRYEAPEQLIELLWSEVGDATDLDLLDLGCGTGLVGVGLKPKAAFLAGIDISSGMLALARERGIYDLLEEAEITGWLESGGASGDAVRTFDAVTACDCLVYFGDLSRVVQSVAKRLKPGGWFAFTVERGDENPHKLMDSGRYKHHGKHVREAAAHAGLEVASIEEGYLRYEGGAQVMGLYTVLQKPVA